MPSWSEHISQGNLTVKGKKANAHQAEMMALIATRTRSKGGDLESCAGAIATAIQESTVTNINFGDRDSLGLYQQRPSMGWGTAAQVTTPSYAIDKFLSIYLPYRRQGLGWLQASHKTQRSAFASAPAKWYPEALRAASYFTGGGGAGAGESVGTTGDGGSSYTEVRDLPYEFSRGTPDKKEDTWTCIGRLADEVNWKRFTRGTGELWFVTEDWLGKQPAKYRISETSRGVIALNFEFETRQEAAEANLKIVAGRYALGPGDVVQLFDEGPADGKWLVASTRRDLFSVTQDVQLKRVGVKLREPAPERETRTITVAGNDVEMAGSGAASGDGSLASRVYAAAQQATAKNWIYSQGQRNNFSRYADCSSGVSWVLTAAGIAVPNGWRPGSGNAPVSGNFLGWGQAGRGQRVTVWTNAGHIWMQFHGFPMWRFDTGGGSGGKLHSSARSTGSFVARHWPGT
jgi:hypothetical protein